MEKGIPLRQGVETCSVGISRKYHEVDHRKDNVARKEYVYHKIRSKENGRSAISWIPAPAPGQPCLTERR